MSANTMTEASSVAPNESASSSLLGAEKELLGRVAANVISRSTSNAGATAEPAGKEVKTNDNGVATPMKDGAPAADTKKASSKPRASPFDPTALLDAAKKDLVRAEGHTDAQVVGDAAVVQGAAQDLSDAKSKLLVATARVEDTDQALVAHRPPVERALTPVRAVLLGQGPTARAVYFEARAPDPLLTSDGLLAKMAQGSFGVEGHLVRRLAQAMTQAAPAMRSHAEAKKGLCAAEAHYNQVRGRLEAALSMLRNSLVAAKATERRKLRMALGSGPKLKRGTPSRRTTK